jgi:hypothetical protein
MSREGLENRSRRWALGTVGLVTLLLIWVWAVTASCAQSLWSFPCFLLAVAAFAYLPGSALLAIVGVESEALDRFALSLLLGVNLSGGVYFLLGAMGFPGLVLLWPVLAGAVLAYRRRRAGWAFEISADSSHVLLVALVGLAVLPLTLLPLYFHNACARPDGGLSFYPLPDVILHLSVANELTHALPPQVPFLPGVPLRYHYGMDLLAAMFRTASGLSIPDLTVRFLPVFFLVTTALAVFCFARTWLGSPRGALLATILVLFGEDLSFVPGLLQGSPQPWAVSFFFMPNIVSLYLLNPMLPALGLLFGALLCLSAFHRAADRRWLVLTSLLAAMLVEYKLFAAVQLLLSLAVTGALYLWRFRDQRPLRAAAACLLLAAPVALWFGGSGGPVAFELRPWPYVPAALAALGLGGSPPGPGIAAFVLVALPVYLLGTWGIRVLGLPRALKECFRFTPEAAVRTCLAIFTLVGTPLSMLCSVSPSGYPRFTQYNNASWFLVQSKYLAWIFVVEALIVWSRDKPRVFRLSLAALALGLALPSSIQYFAFQASRARLQEIGPAESSVLAFLDQHGRPGDVVYAPTEVAEHVVSLTRCRAPALTVYPSSFIDREELAGRGNADAVFWADWEKGRVRWDVLVANRAAFLVAPRKSGAIPQEEGLVRAFENEGFFVYRLAAGAPRQSAP